MRNYRIGEKKPSEREQGWRMSYRRDSELQVVVAGTDLPACSQAVRGRLQGIRALRRTRWPHLRNLIYVPAHQSAHSPHKSPLGVGAYPLPAHNAGLNGLLFGASFREATRRLIVGRSITRTKLLLIIQEASGMVAGWHHTPNSTLLPHPLQAESETSSLPTPAAP